MVIKKIKSFKGLFLIPALIALLLGALRGRLKRRLDWNLVEDLAVERRVADTGGTEAGAVAGTTRSRLVAEGTDPVGEKNCEAVHRLMGGNSREAAATGIITTGKTAGREAEVALRKEFIESFLK